MSKHRRLSHLNMLSDAMFAEFGFHSLTDEQKEEVLEFYINKMMKEIDPEDNTN